MKPSDISSRDNSEYLYFLNFITVMRELRTQNVVKRNGIFPLKELKSQPKKGYYYFFITALKKYLEYKFDFLKVEKKRNTTRFELSLRAENNVKYVYGTNAFVDKLVLYHIDKGRQVIDVCDGLNCFKKKGDRFYGTHKEFLAFEYHFEEGTLRNYEVLAIDFFNNLEQRLDLHLNANNHGIDERMLNNLRAIKKHIEGKGYMSSIAPIVKPKKKQYLGQFEGLGKSRWAEPMEVIAGAFLEKEPTIVTTIEVPQVIQREPTLAEFAVIKNIPERTLRDFFQYIQSLNGTPIEDRALIMAKMFYAQNNGNIETITEEEVRRYATEL